MIYSLTNFLENYQTSSNTYLHKVMEATTHINLYHTCQKLIGISFQQFSVLSFRYFLTTMSISLLYTLVLHIKTLINSKESKYF